jgi:hypothetical protein
VEVVLDESCVVVRVVATGRQRKLAMVLVVGGRPARLFLHLTKQAQEVHVRTATLQLQPEETSVGRTRAHEENLVQSQQG